MDQETKRKLADLNLKIRRTRQATTDVMMQENIHLDNEVYRKLMEIESKLDIYENQLANLMKD